MNDAEVARAARKAREADARANAARHARDDAMRKWRDAENPPLRAIAAAAGISHVAVAKILGKRT